MSLNIPHVELGWIGYLIGLLVGLICGGFGAFSLYMIVGLYKGVAGQGRFGVYFAVLGLLTKFPLILMGAYFSAMLGRGPVLLFALGIVVVYSALVWRASRSNLF